MRADETNLYSSPNGDSWFLCRDGASGRAFVKHRANASSGGHETDFEIGDFLNRGPHNPEHEALLRLIEDVVPSPKANRADGAIGAQAAAGNEALRNEEALRAEIALLQEDLAAAVVNLGEAWQALRRLRFAVEIRCSGMIAPERTNATFAEECEQIARGVIAIYERALAAEAQFKKS